MLPLGQVPRHDAIVVREVEAVLEQAVERRGEADDRRRQQDAARSTSLGLAQGGDPVPVLGEMVELPEQHHGVGASSP